MKKLTENNKRELACEIVHALAKTPDAYDQLCASYGVSRAFDLSDDNLRKEYIRNVRTLVQSPEFKSAVPVNNSYAELLEKLVDIEDEEFARTDRTNTGTYGVFGHQMRFDLSKQFPVLSTKKVYMQGVVAELLWFLRGDTNIQYLLKNKCSIWTDWRYKDYLNTFNSRNSQLADIKPLAIKDFENLIVTDGPFAKMWGNIGKGYGYQWRNFGKVLGITHDEDGYAVADYIAQKGFDQIAWVINEIKTNPTSRRLVVSGWNPHDVDKVDLPPCHTLFQFFVKDGKLSCQLYQRSCDVFLGLPFNIASYALLTHIIAQECDLDVGEFVWTGGDVHLYANHVEQAKEQLSRSTVEATLPQIFIPNKPIDQLTVEDIELFGYIPQPTIKAPVAV